HLQFVIVLAAFLPAVWMLLRPVTGAVALALGVGLVAVSPAVQARVLFDPWDVTVAAMLVAGALALGIWIVHGQADTAALAALFLAAALATKIEATAFVLPLLVIAAAAILVRRERERLRGLGLVVAGVVA